MKWHKKGNRLRAETGFSIVESLIGMLVLGITVLALTGAMVSGFSTIRMARDNQRATQIILDKMEMIRLYGWDQLNTAGFVPLVFTVVDTGPAANQTSKSKDQPPTGNTYYGKITLADSPCVTNYRTKSKLVRVQLAWNSGGIRRYRELSTLVTRDGLYSFIY